MVADAAVQKPAQKMGVARRLALEVAVGAVLGFLTWSIVGPSVMGWWYEPPSKDAFSCAGSVRNALSQFVFIRDHRRAGWWLLPSARLVPGPPAVQAKRRLTLALRGGPRRPAGALARRLEPERRVKEQNDHERQHERQCLSFAAAQRDRRNIRTTGAST